MDDDARTRFVEVWGQMGALWGINASMARVHALLMASDDLLGLDDISAALTISRGNASMCLKELRSWGVVRQHKLPGDRRDYYTSEPDVWRMFVAIIRERKRRELDPAVEATQEILAHLGEDEGPAAERMRQMAVLLHSMSAVADKMLVDPQRARMLFSLLSEGQP